MARNFVILIDYWCQQQYAWFTLKIDMLKRIKRQVMFLYSAVIAAVSSPLDRSKRSTLFAIPDRPVHSDTNSASTGSILAMQQLRATTKSLTFSPLSIARYSFIQLSQQGRQWRERKCPIFEMVAKCLVLFHFQYTFFEKLLREKRMQTIRQAV